MYYIQSKSYITISYISNGGVVVLLVVRTGPGIGGLLTG